MPYHPRDPNDQHDNPTRLLARSLLLEVRPQLYGLPAPETPQPDAWTAGVRWTRDAIHTALHRFVATYGRVPTRQDWNASRQYQIPSRSTMCTMYGSVNAGLVDAGLVPDATPRPAPPTPTAQQKGWTAKSHARKGRDE